MKKGNEAKYPEWMLEFVDNDESKAEILVEHYYYKEPLTESQAHYSVKNAAQILKLSPVTLRQYIREDKIYARKLENEWQIPADALFRFMYTRENEHEPDENIPMGVLLFKEISEDGEYEYYNVISDVELKEILDLYINGDDLSTYYGKHEDYNFNGFYALNGYSFSQGKPRKEVADEVYKFPYKVEKQLKAIADTYNWREMPISLTRAKYKEIFGKSPELNEVKLFRAAIDSVEWNNSFYLVDALLVTLAEHLWLSNRIIYAYNRMVSGMIPEDLLWRANELLDIYRYKGFLDLKNHTWEGPESRTQHNLDDYYTACTRKDLDEADIDDIHEVLQEMVDLANSPEFEEYKKEYERG